MFDCSGYTVPCGLESCERLTTWEYARGHFGMCKECFEDAEKQRLM